jgi:plastocyanin
MPARGLAIAVGVAAALVVQACATGAQPSASAVATDRVDMPRSYRYAPGDITVPAGTTVTWTNSDQFTHSVRLVDSGADAVARPGESVTHAFPSPGLYRYICTFHPNDMNGSVVVTER